MRSTSHWGLTRPHYLTRGKIAIFGYLGVGLRFCSPSSLLARAKLRRVKAAKFDFCQWSNGCCLSYYLCFLSS